MATPFSDRLVDSMPSASLTSSDPFLASSDSSLTSSNFTRPPPNFLEGLPKRTVNHVFVSIRDLEKQVKDQGDLLKNNKSRNQYLRSSCVPYKVFQKSLEILV